MKPRSLLLMAVAVMATTGFLSASFNQVNAGEQPLILARVTGPGYDTIAPPPPPPPAEIRGVPGPPPEVRPGSQMDEIRRMAPPEDLQKGPGEAPGAPGDRSGAAAEAAAGLELAVVSLGLSSANPKVGERVFATATLRNKGSRTLTGVKVRFFLGQVQVGEKVVTVPAGGSATASLSFKAAQAGAQNLKVQVDPGAGLAPLALARGLMVMAAAKTDVEDFTTPTPKTTATKELPPQRLTFHKPQDAKGEGEVGKKGIEWGRKDKDKGGTEGGTSSGGTGGRGEGGVGSKAEDMEGLSPIPEDLEGQTKVGKGPGGMVVGWGDGIHGVEGTGTGIPAPPAGAEELDRLLADAKKGPKPGSEAGGLYGPARPGIGPDKWAKGYGPGESAMSSFKYWCKYMRDSSSGPGAPAADDIKMVSYSKDDDNVYSVTVTYENDAKTIYTYYKDKKGNTQTATQNVPPPGGGLAPEEAGVKPSPKTPDPEMARILMKDPGKSKTDPRIGMVGDPPRLVATMTGAAPAGAETKGMATGGGKIVATWNFAGVKPGAFLKGPRDPDLPGGGGAGGGLRPDLRIFILPDPPEAKAISAALAKVGASGAPGVTVSSVAGAVQVLKTQESKQGWTPLTAGNKLAGNSVIRVDKGTGGEVRVADLKTALSMNWAKIHSSANHTVYLLSLRK